MARDRITVLCTKKEIVFTCVAYCANLQVMDDMVDNEHSFTFGSFLI